ncbi:MAG: hypothetical protein IPG25_01470 [Proteobacteria bacterium]|nr:hypothetical protein [Pseudomonadota bacterium]
MPDTRTAPFLERILEVTYTVPDLDLIESTYTRWLGYRVTERGTISESTARGWEAPALVGRRQLALEPAHGESVVLRFVAEPLAAGWQALKTFGWNVSEIVVEDVDALAARLADSPFRIIGAPASLARFPMIRAMQVVGPAGECLYFTQVGAGSGLELARAQAPVGRVFIVVAAGPDVHRLFDMYAAFGNEVDTPVSTCVQVISRANDLPADTLHAHGLVKLGNGSLIELDEYPAVATSRIVPSGGLPVGMALVEFETRGMQGSVLLRGAANECIRLVGTNLEDQ